ncbi:acyl-CoA N-acyltransferase [Jimgerdemannia flammicorona]|uniref:Acyl-CoA N-acyltransferase n=2 Tax=Jimgerdemannia flammicorona TaxID=994334 RepID=A0A433DF33_9FUNG|nr:acyl-CoA N-acyltransferase [Jimgerdemannia flammicorona]RUS27067.1 acyl-CoA N-acyltransferase [Jimgerdemannia flammicorona]
MAFSTPQDYTIRPGTLPDAAAMAQCNLESIRVAFAELMPASWLHAPSTADSYLTKWTDHLTPRPVPDGIHLLAETHSDSEPARVVAVANAGPLRPYIGLESLDRATMLQLWTLYVHPTAQGTGLGRRLFLEAVKSAHETWPACSDKLIVLTFEGNTNGRRFYEKLGGTLWGILPKYPLPLGGGNCDIATYEWDGVAEWITKWEKGSR